MPFVPNGTLTFCSDFGTADGYAAAMKGQALRVEPELQIMDISHDIPPWDIRRAAFALWTSLPVFPSGTVHVVVIDPGVGTERRSLVAIAGDQVIVAPDNGLISLLCRRFPSMEVYELTIPPESALSLSATFHGRDVYAPTGARIAAGALSVPGGMSPLSNPVLFDCGYVSEAEQVRGSVVCADRFGNIITSIPWSCVSAPKRSTVAVGDMAIDSFVRTFGDASPGSLCFLQGSSGLLEISCVEGSAIARCAVEPGHPVFVAPSPESRHSRRPQT